MNDTASDASAWPGRVVAVDFGTKRIGLAISDPEQKVASPLTVYERQSPEQEARWFRRLVADEAVVLFVVGLPVHASGAESRLSEKARRFGRWLAETTAVDVQFYDERYTSLEADQLMAPAGLTKKRRKARRDMLAAQILLASFLESRHRGRQHPEPLDDEP